MKRSLLFASVAVALSATAGVVSAPLPTPVVRTAPQQGLVNVGPNTFGRGVSDIEITFSSKPEVNNYCTEPSLLYKDDMTVPVESSTECAVGIMDFNTNCGMVYFINRVYRADGIYKVEIPAGRFYVNDAPTPKITLNYEIHNGYVVSPAPGVVEWLQDICFTYPNAVKVEMLTTEGIQFQKQGSAGGAYIYPNVLDQNGDGFENTVAFNFGTSDGIARMFIDPGSFLLMIPQGCIRYWEPGPSYPGNPNDLEEYENFEIRLVYSIPSSPQPPIEPMPGKLKSFTAWTVNVDEEFTVWMVDDKNSSYLYPVLPGGEIDTDSPICTVKVDPTSRQGNSFTMRILDTEHGVWIDELKLPDGEYALRLGRELYSGMFNDNFISSDPYDYRYTIENPILSGVECVDAPSEGQTVKVYNLQGVCVKAGADASNPLEGLPEGLYIAAGRKLLK